MQPARHPIPTGQGLRLTDHASIRMQQRGIPSWFLRLLLEQGKTTHDGHGAQVKSVSKATRRRLQTVLPHRLFVEAERYFDVYAVVAAHPARRIRAASHAPGEPHRRTPTASLAAGLNKTLTLRRRQDEKRQARFRA